MLSRRQGSLIVIGFLALNGFKSFGQHYTGSPWNGCIQEIPGKIQCEWYDLGERGFPIMMMIPSITEAEN